MPELCRFYNIIIRMLYSDDDQLHKPHIHVQYAEYRASIGWMANYLRVVFPRNSLDLSELG